MIIDFSKRPLFLAPLAGYTDLPFRSVVKKFGVDVTVSEMISSNALVYNSKRTIKMLEKSDNEKPYSVQISGNSAEVIKGAVEVLNKLDYIDIIDFNCGCPATKVVKHGSGSSLLKDLDKMQFFIETIKKTSNKKLTSVKIRIGFDEKNPINIAKACEEAGADFIAIHGRTKKDGYKKDAIDYHSIKSIKENIKIPVIANGEIDSFKKAEEVFNYTKADGIMIGRGAIGNPWIFYQVKNKIEDISQDIKREIIIEHFDKMIEFYGEFGVILFRKHLHTYSKSYNGASNFRQIINQIKDINLVRDEIKNFF